MSDVDLTVEAARLLGMKYREVVAVKVVSDRLLDVTLHDGRTVSAERTMRWADLAQPDDVVRVGEIEPEPFTPEKDGEIKPAPRRNKRRQ